MTAAGWLFLLAALLFALALHPFLSYPLTLQLLAWLRPARRAMPAASGAPDPRPRFAILMCAYNEAAVLDAKLRNLLALQRSQPEGAVEILVYIDAASDRSAEIASRYEPHIQLHVASERHGKTHGMNLLVKRSRAPLLLFTDATVMLDPQALSTLAPHFDDPQVGCVSANLVYTNPSDSVTAASGSLYWRIEQRLKRLEQRSGSTMGAHGALFAIRRELHEPPPDHIIDDMYVSLAILCQGKRLIQADDVLAWEASVSASREEFRRKVRIACQAFNVHRLLWPRLKRLPAVELYKYVSHKLLRWFTIYLLAGAALCLVLGLIAAGHALLALGLAVGVPLCLWLGHRLALKPVAQISDALLAFAGVGLGVWRSLRGERFQTWTPAASIRKA